MAKPRTNRLLDALSPASREQLLSVAKEVDLPTRTSLQAPEEQPRYVYFMTSGIASVVVGLSEGGTAETALIGNEGIAGAYALLGSAASPMECFIQLPGTALRVPFGAVQELFHESREIRTRILHASSNRLSPPASLRHAISCMTPKRAWRDGC